MLRLLRPFTRFRVILRTTKAVLSSFRSLFILEFCIGYVFAIVGMQLFAGLVDKDIVETLCSEQLESFVVHSKCLDFQDVFGNVESFKILLKMFTDFAKI